MKGKRNKNVTAVLEKFSPHGVQSAALNSKGIIAICPLLIFGVWDGLTSVSI